MDVNGAVERLFAPARRPGRVGAEVELIPVTDTARPRAVDPAVLAAGFDAGFVRAVAPSFEPGGQLELSPAPRPTAAALIRDLDRMLRRAAAIAAARGIRLEATGLNPYHSCADVPLRLRTPRYLAMQRDVRRDRPGRAPDDAPYGLAADQRSTCFLAAPGRSSGWSPTSQAHLSRPPSPIPGRWRAARPVSKAPARGSGRTSTRAGPDTTGGTSTCSIPVGAYAAFAAAAPRCPSRGPQRPSYHLSTLFPPVRPRGGYLEVRYLDAQPPRRVGEAVATVAALLYDARARHDALDLLLPRAA